MRPRPEDPALVVILAAAPTARAVARYYDVPERDVEDVVQSALFAAWRSVQRGNIVLADTSPVTRERAQQYVGACARHIALLQRKKIARAGLLRGDDRPEPAVDPLRRIEARAELRVVPEPMYMRALYELLAAGDSLTDAADKLGIPLGPLATRLRALRALMKRRRR